MGFQRAYSVADTFITNKLQFNEIPATGSNNGSNPVLSVFAQNVVGPEELARILIRFDTTSLSQSMFVNKTIPSSSVQFILKMYDMTTGDTLPPGFDLFVYPLSRSWDEGSGMDDKNWQDIGFANWMSASSVQGWTTTGSDYINNIVALSASQHFPSGSENLEVDITPIVNEWLTGSRIPNYGLLIKMSDAIEVSGGFYYRKAFQSRETPYVDRIPYMEARWSSDLIKDNRNNCLFNNLNTLYMYNIVRGSAQELSQPIFVQIQNQFLSGSPVLVLTASRLNTGIYSASFTLNTPYLSSSWNDIWFSGSSLYMSGTFIPVQATGSQLDPYSEYSLQVTNLKRVYSVNEQAHLIVTARDKNFITHFGSIYSASLNLGTQQDYFENMYYSILNNETGETVVSYGTGSNNPYTQLSYDGNGHWLNLNMSSFVQGFVYELIFLININGENKEIRDSFLFKVV